MDNKNRFLSGVYHDLYEKKPVSDINTGNEPADESMNPPISGTSRKAPTDTGPNSPGADNEILSGKKTAMNSTNPFIAGSKPTRLKPFIPIAGSAGNLEKELNASTRLSL